MNAARLTATGLALALVLAPAAASAGGPHGQDKGPGRGHDANSLDLTLLATTDMHGRIFNWDYFRDTTYSERSGDTIGLARVASIVDDVRDEVGDEQLLVVDNGDAIQGTPLTYFYASVEPIVETGAEHPMATAYNQIGYDAQVVGNHEFNYGLEHLKAYEGDLGMPLLGANVVDAETGDPWLQPWTMVTKNVKGHKPVNVGILGLTTPGSAVWDKGHVEGILEFRDMVDTAAEYVPQMKAAGADVVVVLSHAGIGDSSYSGGDLPEENPADDIAREVPGIDLMVIGHTHQDVPQQFITNEVTGEQVLLTQPYRWGGSVARVDLDLQKTRGQWDVEAAEAVAIRTQDYEESPAILASTQEAHDKTVEYVNQVVATATEELSGADSYWKDSAIVDFIQQVQTETVDAALEGTAYADLPVLSLAAPFSRSALFPAGNVSIRDIAGLYIYDNTLHAVTMNGAQIKDYLEYGNGMYFRTLAAGDTFDPATDVNLDNRPDYHLDLLSGVSYEVDLTEAVGSKIENLSLADGTPVTDDMDFVVAVNNYRRSGGGAYPHITTAPLVYDQQQEIRQLLIDWASQKGVIDPGDFYTESWWLTVAGERVAQ